MIKMENDCNAPSCIYPACGCVGYGYVPFQELNETYCVSTGFEQGTIFPELDLDICEYGKVCKKWGGGMNA